MRDIENIQLKNEAKRKEGKDTPIYRYISAERYFELIEKRENSFSLQQELDIVRTGDELQCEYEEGRHPLHLRRE